MTPVLTSTHRSAEVQTLCIPVEKQRGHNDKPGCKVKETSFQKNLENLFELRIQVYK